MLSMRRLLPWLAAVAAAVIVPVAGAAAVSPTVRLTIDHIVQGCHSWGTAESEPIGPKRKIVVRRGTRLQIRVSCPMDFLFAQTAGPKLKLGDPVTHTGTVRTIVFAKRGTYRLRAANVQSSEQMNLQTLGPDTVLVLTVVVR
jgi:FtsP/CotA-like multicopper oxidase with cupredoxin domain